MLERLDDIPWRKYHDAYGPATKTPGRLRALASNDPATREAALDELSYTIYHQGSVYEATIHAVPFLLEMLAEPAYAGKAQVLELLQMIAEGTSYHDVHQHMILLQEKAKTAEYQATVQKEKAWVAAIAVEIRKGLELFLSLLKDSDPAVRIAAAGMLVRMKDVAAQTRGPLTELLTSDHDPRVRVAALAGLSTTDDPGVRDILRQVFAAADSNPPSRATAAILLTGMDGAQADPAMIRLCRAVAGGASGDLGEPSELLGSWEEAATLALATRDHPPDDVVERMIAVVEAAAPSEQHAVGLLLILLGEGRGPWRDEDLTPLQRRGIAAVARYAFPEHATVYVNMADVLKAFGLPQDRSAMEALVGQPMPRYRRDSFARDRSGGKPWWKFW